MVAPPCHLPAQDARLTEKRRASALQASRTRANLASSVVRAAGALQTGRLALRGQLRLPEGRVAL